jgi:hypothetical protein
VSVESGPVPVVVEEAMGMEEMDAALPQVLMMGLVEERVVIPL